MTSDATNKSVRRERFLPLWIHALIAIELILIVGVTVAAVKDITVLHPEQPGPTYLGSLYITRNFVACAGLALTTYVFKSHIALFVMLISRIATEIADFTNSYLFERSPEVLEKIPYLIVLMVVVPVIAACLLWPRMRAEMMRLNAV